MDGPSSGPSALLMANTSAPCISADCFAPALLDFAGGDAALVFLGQFHIDAAVDAVEAVGGHVVQQAFVRTAFLR